MISRSLLSGLLSIICSAVCCIATFAQEGFPILVTDNGAPINDESQVVGKASRDMLLWCSKLSAEKQWAFVKVPSSDRVGWISVGDVTNIEIPARDLRRWESAHAYFDEWQSLVDVRSYRQAATVAENAATAMNSILEDLIGSVYPGYPPAATALNQAGVAMLRAGGTKDAQRLFELAVDIAEASLGTRDTNTSVYRSNLAEALALQGHYSKAISHFDISLPVLEKNSGDLSSVHIDNYFVRYGTSLAHEHRIFDARIAFAKAVRAVVARNGERSRELARVQTAFAAAMDQAGEHVDAVRQLSRSLEIYREIIDAENPLLLDTLNQLSAYATRAAQFRDAKRYAEEAVDIQRQTGDTTPTRLAASLNNLGLANAELGEFDAAHTALDEALQLIETGEGKDSVASTFPLKNQAVLASKQRDYGSARETLEAVLRIRQSANGVNDRSLADVHGLLAEVASAESDQASAKAHFSNAIRIQSSSIGIDHPDARRNIDSLRTLFADDEAAHEELDRVIAEARRAMRLQVTSDVPESDYQLDAIAAEYRLQRILAGRQTSAPETQFFALEITEDNAAVRTGDLIATTLPVETVVYAFRAEGDQALIKIPGKEKLGWIGQKSVSEIRYSGELLEKLGRADEQLDEGLREHLEGDNKSALARIRHALKIFDEELGEGSAPSAAARFTLGAVLSAAGDVRVAVQECRNAEVTLVDLLGETHFETAKARNNLAKALLDLGKPADALRPAAQALQVASGFGDEQREFQAKVAGNVGLALMKLTHFEAAREYFDYALKLSLEANGENHFGTARCYAHLGRLHSALREFAEAQEAFGKAYRIADRVSGPASADTTDAMVRFGKSLVANQKIAPGRKLIDEAAAIDLRERGPLDVSTIRSDAARAALALNVGNSTAAKSILESVVKRALRRFGKEHPSVLTFRKLFAETLYVEGEYEAALSEAEEVASRLRTSLDEANHEAIDSIRTVGVYSAALGRLDVARVNYETALRLAQQVLGPNHPDTAECLFNIGEVALMAKDYVAARPRIEASIVALQRNQDHVVTDMCIARTMLGYIDVGQGDTRSAAKNFDTAAKDTFELMSTVLPALSEKEQLMFLQDDLREMQDAWLTLPITDGGNKRVASASSLWHLNMKASSHELLATQARIARDSVDVGNKTAFDELIKVREKLARLSLRTVAPDARATHEETIAKLTIDEERLSREIGEAATKLTESRPWITEEQIRASLSEKSVLINFARIRNANFAYSSERTRWKGDRYFAFVIPPLNRGDILPVDLGLAKNIDERIVAAMESLHSPSAIAEINSAGEKASVATADAALKSLASKVIAPLLPHVEGYEELILSPDGQLWTVPWAALPVGDSEYLIERARVRLSVSGRELLQNTTSKPDSSSAPLIVADPSFDMNPAVAVALNELDSVRTRSAVSRFGEQFQNVKRLPGTATEAAAIQGSVERFTGQAPKMFLQRDATEAVVKNAKSPQCLILSTHGFFFDAPQPRKSARSRGASAGVPQNPLLRCGLLLAGCHYAHEAPEGSDDGILTGMEIISSDLRNTDLVVLSACETGLGDLRSGEGVAGLRQAFQLAGAQSVVASLWQVDDASTARLMDDFFGNLAQGMPKSEALRQAQLNRIASRRDRHGAAHPFFWAAFTLTGHD